MRQLVRQAQALLTRCYLSSAPCLESISVKQTKRNMEQAQQELEALILQSDLNMQADNLLYWVTQNKMVTEQGQRVEFNDHPFLAQIYEDKASDICIIKSAQVGGTIWATAGSAHEVTHEKRNAIYVFPTRGSIINDFVIPKVNPLIEKNKFIAKHIVQDTQKLKQFKDNFLYYRGAFSESDAISISADTVWSDEYDRSNTRIVRTYRSRTENSKDPRFRTFSNPSAKGF